MEVSTKLMAVYNPVSQTEMLFSFDLGLRMMFSLVGFPSSGGFYLAPTLQDRLATCSQVWLAGCSLVGHKPLHISKAKNREMQRASKQGNIELMRDFLKVFFVILTHLIEAGSKNYLNPTWGLLAGR